MTLDPLLTPPPPPPADRTSAASATRPTRATGAGKRTRRPSPAAAARILATGLATTAMLGLTTGYALAKKAQQPEISPSAPKQSTDQASQTPSVPSQTPATSPDRNVSGNLGSPVVTSPPVVEIPVPEIAPAQPGNNWNGGNNQPSNGSN